MIYLFVRLCEEELRALGLYDSFEVARHITFRAALAALTAFLTWVFLGPRAIAWLRARFRDRISERSPEIAALSQSKIETPTMGGLFILAAMLGASLLWADLASGYVLVGVLTALWLGGVGAADDYLKLSRGSPGTQLTWSPPASRQPDTGVARGKDASAFAAPDDQGPHEQQDGLSVKEKLALQTVLGLLVGAFLYFHQGNTTDGLKISLPLVGIEGSLGVWLVPLAALVIVASSNAVNLTDGLDGLAGGCMVFAGAAFVVVSYLAGHAVLAEYLGVPYLPGSGELCVLLAAMTGAVLGFLWHNCHPAAVFMGDTGSLPLGGLIGYAAVVTRQEFLLVLVGGVFVLEAASVLVQVGSFKLTGRRVLRCAPLHHHLQLLGWHENQIVVRMWIAAAVLALVAVATLRLV